MNQSTIGFSDYSTIERAQNSWIRGLEGTVDLEKTRIDKVTGIDALEKVRYCLPSLSLWQDFLILKGFNESLDPEVLGNLLNLICPAIKSN